MNSKSKHESTKIQPTDSVILATVRAVSERSRLDVYPLVLSSGQDHVEALSGALATFGRTVRLGIEA